MFDLVVITASVLTLLASAGLYRVASGEPVWRPNMLNFSFLILVPLTFFSSTMVVLDWSALGYDPYVMGPILRGATDPTFKVWLAVMWMLLAMPLGAIFTNIAVSRRTTMRRAMRRFRENPVVESVRLNKQSLFILVGLLSVVVGGLLLLWVPRTNALTTIRDTGNVIAAQIVRREATYGSGIGFVDAIINLGMFQWLNFVAFAMALSTKAKRWWYLFAFGFVCICFISISKGTIGHIVLYGVALAFLRSILGGPFIRLFEGVAAGLVIAFLAVVFKGTEGSLLEVLFKSVANRIMFGQMLGTYLSMDYIPRIQDFIGLRSTGHLIHQVLGLESLPNYGLILMNLYNPSAVAAGYGGHLTTVYIGEAWANFGYFGLVLAPLWVGGVVQLVNKFFVARPKTAVSLAFYAYLAVNFEYAQGFMAFYYPAGTLVFVAGALLVLYLARFGLLPKRRTRHRVGITMGSGGSS